MGRIACMAITKGNAVVATTESTNLEIVDGRLGEVRNLFVKGSCFLNKSWEFMFLRNL